MSSIMNNCLARGNKSLCLATSTNSKKERKWSRETIKSKYFLSTILLYALYPIFFNDFDQSLLQK